MSDEPLRVLIADDDPLARGALRRALGEAGIDVVAETGSPLQTAELAAAQRPDVVLMDAALGAGRPPEPIALVLDRAPEVRVLVLANAPETRAAMTALRAGASGYLSRDIDLVALARAVRGVAAGEAAVSRELTDELLRAVRELPARDAGMRPVTSPLTTREWEVLDLLCLERSTQEIAATLFITDETVRSHVRNILRKLDVGSRAEAVRAAGALRGTG
ncbi:MAG: response regulator transcription factor [Solirubrobacterales bacterium]|nr:response regulator transcription factor [Solirubrobacterales bacterium]